MDAQEIRAEFKKRIEAGEPLVTLDKVPALKSLSNSTRANMANAGRIPVIRSGRRFFTLVSLVNESLLELIVEPKPGKAAPPIGSKASLVGKGLESLKAMGYRPIPFDRKDLPRKPTK